MGSLYENIQDLCSQKGIRIGRMCEEIGVSKGTFTDLKMGRRTGISAVTAQKIASYFGVSVAYLLGEDELLPSNVFKIETKQIPLLGNIACGEPIFAEEDFGAYVEVGSNIQADFCLRASGDSMVGARIHHGDIVFIRKQEMVNNGEIAAVLIGDEATLKRVNFDRESGLLQLFAENPMYETLRFSGEDLNKIRILGKAIAFQSDIR